MKIELAFLGYLLFTILFLGCNVSAKQGATVAPTGQQDRVVVSSDYELHLPSSETKALLVVFGGFPETATSIQREFKILEPAKQNGLAVLLMNFNRRIWLEEAEQIQLAKLLEGVAKQYKLRTEKIFIGGFSSGGNVSLLLANHLLRKQSSVRPEGVFIVDSPVDLLALYCCSQKNIARNFNPGSVMESQGTVDRLDVAFGRPEDGLEAYKANSPFLASEAYAANISALDRTKIRLYTEPDVSWWQQNRANNYEDMNAYGIKKLAIHLREEMKNPNVELIETENKGYRSNGLRHPHSWSIVDVDELLHWILK